MIMKLLYKCNKLLRNKRTKINLTVFTKSKKKKRNLLALNVINTFFSPFQSIGTLRRGSKQGKARGRSSYEED